MTTELLFEGYHPQNGAIETHQTATQIQTWFSQLITAEPIQWKMKNEDGNYSLFQAIQPSPNDYEIYRHEAGQWHLLSLFTITPLVLDAILFHCYDALIPTT